MCCFKPFGVTDDKILPVLKNIQIFHRCTKRTRARMLFLCTNTNTCVPAHTTNTQKNGIPHAQDSRRASLLPSEIAASAGGGSVARFYCLLTQNRSYRKIMRIMGLNFVITQTRVRVSRVPYFADARAGARSINLCAPVEAKANCTQTHASPRTHAHTHRIA